MGLSREDYEAVIARMTGKSSAGLCSIAELERVVEEMQRLGWRPAAPRPARCGARPADHPAARKARALWISLWQLGAVSNRSEAALEAFARRQLGCTRLQWADQAQVFRVTEALKAIGRRHGWDPDWISTGDQVKDLIRAIDAKLRVLEPDAPSVEQRFGTCWHREPMAALYRMADAMGAALRAAQARRAG
ncbi:regulatory protein GemA [Thermaurantiacus tibetensis]|uniref:regulatory protein GemA n=1 Tax=Thermaurantiacus tibetensis TaxID=2759035 RepID=UPI00189086FF|nr:regulatory protein GemA [Thermaurantiacus tibetensis]